MLGLYVSVPPLHRESTQSLIVSMFINGPDVCFVNSHNSELYIGHIMYMYILSTEKAAETPCRDNGKSYIYIM